MEKMSETQNWTNHVWQVGEPITAPLLNNMGNGMQILMTQMDAILREIGGALSPDAAGNINLNKSRIDGLENEICGDTIDFDENEGYRNTRIDKLEASMGAYDDSVRALISEIGGTMTNNGFTASKIDAIIAELTGKVIDGAANLSQNTRLTDLELELGGTRNEGYGYVNSRLDDLETELGGTRSAGNGYVGSRLDEFDNHFSAVDSELKGTYTDGVGYVGSRLDSLEAELGVNEQSRDGGNGYALSRLDKQEAELTDATTTYFGGNSRLTKLETRATALEDKTNETSDVVDYCQNFLDAIEQELGTTHSGGSGDVPFTWDGNSRLDDLEAEIGGTRNVGSGYDGSRLDTLELLGEALATEIGGTQDSANGFVGSRLDAIEAELGGTRDAGTGYENSRIDVLEERADENDGINDAQNYKLSAILNNLDGAYNDSTDQFSAATRLDSLEKEVCGGTITRDNYNGYTNSRIDDIEAEIGGTRSNGNGYSGSRIDVLEERANTNDTANATQNRYLAALLGQIGGTNVDTGSQVNITNSRIDNLVSRATNSENKNTEQDGKLIAILTELGGGMVEDSIYKGTSRLSSLESRATTTEQLNVSQNNQLEAVRKELGGGSYNGDLYNGNSRLTNLENRATALEQTTTAQNEDIDNLQSKLSAVTTEIYNADSISGNSRIDTIENTLQTDRNDIDDLTDKLSVITTEIYGADDASTDPSRIDSLETRMDAAELVNADVVEMKPNVEALISEVYGASTVTNSSRIDDLESEIWGTSRNVGNGYNNSILDYLRNTLGPATARDDENHKFVGTRIDALEAIAETSQGDVSSLVSKLSAVVTEVYGVDDVNTTISRIDINDNLIASLAAALGGTYDNTNGQYINTKIDYLINTLGSRAEPDDVNHLYTNTRLDDISTITNNHTDLISALSKAVGGTYNTTNKTLVGNRIDALENSTTSLDQRLELVEASIEGEGMDGYAEAIARHNQQIAAIISEIGGRVNGTTYEGITRIDALEEGASVSGSTTILEHIEKLITEVYGVNDVNTDPSRIDSLESRANDLETTAETTTSNIEALQTAVEALQNAGFISDVSAIESKLSQVTTELYGQDNTSINPSRMDQAETNISGLDGRIQVLENDTTSADNAAAINEQSRKIAAIINEIGGSINGNTYEGTTRIDSNEAAVGTLQSSFAALQSLVNSDNTALSNLITKVSTITSQIYGEDDTSVSPSRIDMLESDSSNLKNRVQTLENDTTLTNLITKVDTITTEIYGDNSISGTSRIDTLEQSGKINSYTTINAEPSDALMLEDDVLLFNNSISFIFIENGTLGTANLTVNNLPVYLTKTNRFKGAFMAGSLLGVFRKDNNLYLFNAPMVL